MIENRHFPTEGTSALKRDVCCSAPRGFELKLVRSAPCEKSYLDDLRGKPFNQFSCWETILTFAVFTATALMFVLAGA